MGSGLVMTPVCETLGAADGLETVATMMQDVVSALEFAHEAGYLHRDISVGNVMWDPVRQRGCLVDWHAALSLLLAGALTTDGLRSITGTRPFTAVS